MTADDRILEQEIERVSMLVQLATTAVMRRIYVKRLGLLVEKRRPERVAEMERAAGLRQ